PLKIAEMFYSENGVPIDEDVNYDYQNRYKIGKADIMHKHYVRPGFETAKLNLNREVRFYASLGFDGWIWFGHGVKGDDDALIVEGIRRENASRLVANRRTQNVY